MQTGYLTKKIIDSDGDGLTDYDEIYGMRTNSGIYNTDPHNPDSDGDGLTDGKEMGVLKWSRFVPGYYFYLNSDPLRIDSDNDGLDDLDEYYHGSEPLNQHSDADNVNDGDEIKISTSPVDWDSDDDGIADGVHYIIATDLIFEELRRTLSEQGNNDELINIIMPTIKKKIQTWPPKEFIVYNTASGFLPKGFPVLWTVDGGKTVSDSQLEFGLKGGLIGGAGGVNNGPHKYLSDVFFDKVVPISGGTIEMQPYADIGSFHLKGESADTLIIVARDNPDAESVEHEYIVEYIIAGGVIIVAAGVIIISLPGAGVAVATGAAVGASAAFIIFLASVDYPEEYFKLLEDEGFEVYDNAYGTA